MTVRVRYAPSPTGFQHIGGVRTALFNYLYARSRGGRFLLRIEDTDRERYREEALQDIYATFAWLGFRWDEGPDVGGPVGPYFQSERFDLYRSHAAELVARGEAYPCYCSQERLARLKEEQSRRRGPLGYDRRCRELTKEERLRLEGEGNRPVVRLKVPLEGATAFEDRLLGRVETRNADVSPDPVLLKSDGFPTYHLANVVDDHAMEITDVLRAQEWLPSTPLHVLLYRAFGWQPPRFCHLPMVLGPDGQKLSKRHGATRVGEFRRRGYLPEALVNYVALLGWSYDDSREMFTLAELEGSFALERLNKAAAVFDYKKLDWFNGQYIRRLAPQELAGRLLPFLQEAGLVGAEPGAEERRLLEGLVPLVQPRLTVLADVVELAAFLFQGIERYDLQELVPRRLDRRRTAEALGALRTELPGFAGRSEEESEGRLRSLAEALGMKFGDLMMCLRVAVTGSRVSPPLFASLLLLGESEALRRVEGALAALESAPEA